MENAERDSPGVLETNLEIKSESSLETARALHHPTGAAAMSEKSHFMASKAVKFKLLNYKLLQKYCLMAYLAAQGSGDIGKKMEVMDLCTDLLLPANAVSFQALKDRKLGIRLLFIRGLLPEIFISVKCPILQTTVLYLKGFVLQIWFKGP